METKLLTIPGDPIDPSDLTVVIARDLVDAVGRSSFSSVVSVLRDDDGREIVIVRSDIEVPQYPKADIRNQEVFAVVFQPEDKVVPRILMLREDFPELLHLLLEPAEFPRSLCLYNIPYEDVKLFLTGFSLLERIREWLKLSAVGELHQKDQPLEPLILDDDGIILLNDPFSDKQVFIYVMGEDHLGRPTFLATSDMVGNPKNLFKAQVELIKAEPQVHGVIRHSPREMGALSDLLSKAGVDLPQYFKQKLLEYKEAGVDLQAKMVLIVDLPKISEAGAEPSSSDTFVFMSNESIEEIGCRLNIWEKVAGVGLGLVFNQPLTAEALKTVAIGILRPVTPYNRHLANVMNGVDENVSKVNFLAVGAGALGSQVVTNLVRAGIGPWVSMDPDIYLPHNSSRHASPGFELMKPKVIGLARQANSILPGMVVPLVKDIIKNSTDAVVLKAIGDAEIIVDLTASSAALKSVEDLAPSKRVVSMFLNPSGSDFVAITQDKEAAISVTSLEIQYLRFIFHTTILHDHFKQNGEVIRYSLGCRDISFSLPQDVIATAAAIGSKVIKRVLTQDAASIKIWRTNPESFTTACYEVPVRVSRKHIMGNWTIVYDDYVIEKMYEQRNQKLPNETGGIMIGSYDMQRKTIFVADILGSPEDSYEYPTAYIRGIKGLDQELKTLENVTAGGLQYIGEWHSHPDGYGPGMSEDDAILFAWMKENMRNEGLPALMLIAGHQQSFAFYLM